jgi:choline kinase
VGYDQKRIKEALRGLPITFYENVFYSITNSLVSLWFAKNALDGDVVILGNADVYWENNLLSKLLSETRDCVMLCDSSRVMQGDYLFYVVNGRLVNYGKGLDCNMANCEYVGLAAIRGDMIIKSRERLEMLIRNQQHSEWWEQILYSMVKERPIWIEDIAGSFWAEIDYIEDYRRILDYRKCLNG